MKGKINKLKGDSDPNPNLEQRENCQQKKLEVLIDDVMADSPLLLAYFEVSGTKFFIFLDPNSCIPRNWNLSLFLAGAMTIAMIYPRSILSVSAARTDVESRISCRVSCPVGMGDADAVVIRMLLLAEAPEEYT
jgi:hypothetical protein